ncbi:hypothetical protein LCGC14_1493240 [marine sediment metagenome]|uniref:Uncharacterized protein n=1 Tax=marine sediment metagenome TaxID=412755 RepID=A0A0F9J6R4_9ZZZZ
MAKLAQAIKILKANTMACWWPNGPYPGKQGTDWQGISGEVSYLLSGIKQRQDIDPTALFFVLDPANSETALYDELLTALHTVNEAMHNN